MVPRPRGIYHFVAVRPGRSISPTDRDQPQALPGSFSQVLGRWEWRRSAHEMTAVSDSSATFSAKALAYGIPQSSLDRWKADGLCAYSNLLFRVASAPGQTDSGKLQKLLDEMEPKATATASVASAVNRLLFEAP